MHPIDPRDITLGPDGRVELADDAWSHELKAGVNYPLSTNGICENTSNCNGSTNTTTCNNYTRCEKSKNTTCPVTERN